MMRWTSSWLYSAPAPVRANQNLYNNTNKSKWIILLHIEQHGTMFMSIATNNINAN